MKKSTTSSVSFFDQPISWRTQERIENVLLIIGAVLLGGLFLAMGIAEANHAMECRNNPESSACR